MGIPWGSVVRTLPSHCYGPNAQSVQQSPIEELRSQWSHTRGAKKKKKKLYNTS